IQHYFRLLRPADWIKNIFVFAPLFFAHEFFNANKFLIVFYGAVLFSIIASSIYALNDYKDLVADRMHPTKCKRPVASGDITPKAAVTVFVVLAAIGLLAALNLSTDFFVVTAFYFLINIAYCFYLKNIAIIDVYCIAAGFILRVIGGAVLLSIEPTLWIILCVGLLALFLGLAKRRDDFVCAMNEHHRKSMCGYNRNFIDVAIGIVLGALFVFYVIYTTQPANVADLGTAHFYVTAPLVLLGILRYLQLTLVEEKSASPTQLLCSDHFLFAIVVSWVVVSGLLIYQ
ncbi:MAG: hypothetical protein A2624_06885, partial [Gammaproteobacteria bacterium RIFCSPHIGHO2_01_FULL_42_8]